MTAERFDHGGILFWGIKCFLLLILIFGLLCPQAALADGNADDLYQQLFGENSEQSAEQLFLRIETDRDILLAQTVIAIKKEDRIFLDFIATIDAMGFAISWDASVITGWARSKTNPFYLDPKTPELLLKGEEVAIDGGDIEILDGTLYVALDQLAIWFNVEYGLDEAGQSVTLKGEPVPSEDAILRQRIRDKIQIGTSQVDPSFWKTGEHSFLSWPNLNFISNNNWSQSKNEVTSSLQAIAEVDFLKTRTKITANAIRGSGLTDLRLESRRTELDQDLPYSEFSVGDITSFRSVNAANSKRGLGFKITNKPLSASSILGEENIAGDAPVDWEAELYRNDTLVDFQIIGEDGRYSFDAVPLGKGVNDIKVVLYGPQGQTRIIEEKVLADSNNPQPGEIRYSLSLSKDETSLFGLREKKLKENNPNYTSSEDLYRFSSEVSYGLTNQFAIAGGLSQSPEPEGDMQYASLGIRSSYDGNPITLDLTQGFGLANGQALRLFTRFPILGSNLNFTHNEYFSFEGEQNRIGEDYGSALYTRRTQLFASLPSYRFEVQDKPWNISNSLNINRSEKTDGMLEWEIDPTTTLSTPHGTFTNRLDMNFDKLQGGNTQKSAFGNITGTHTIDDFRIRSTFNYQLLPTISYREISADLDYQYDESLSLQSKLSQNLDADHSISATFGFNGRFDFGEIGMSFTANSRHNRSANLTFSMGLQKDPASGEIEVKSTRSIKGGGIKSRVFVDNNNNGIYDKNDEPLKDILVKSNDVQKYSNEDGLVSLSALPLYRPIEVSLDERSVKDPFLAGIDTKITVALKDGSVLPVDFPLAPSGEVEGVIEIAGTYDDGTVFFRPLSNAIIEVVSKQGDVVGTSISTFDGSYIATNIPIGDYRVRVAKSYLQKIDAQHTPGAQATSATIAAQGDWVEGANLTLVYKNETMGRAINDGKSRTIKDPMNDLINSPSPVMQDTGNSLEGIPAELQKWFQ